VKSLEAWSALPEEERAGQPKPTEPPDPALDSVPEDFIERYRKFWRDRIVREVLAREFLREFAAQAERENRSFEDLAKDYEVLGVSVVSNDEALEDPDFSERFPERLGVDSELETTVRTYLPGPREGQAFTPEVHLQPVPTTRLGSVLDDRGYMVLRLSGFEPSRVRDVSEARDEIVEMWRDHEVRTRAKDRLEAIRAKVMNDEATLEEAAAEHGLDVRHLRRFNRATPERRIPPVAPGEEEDPARAAARDAIAWRNVVVGDYTILSRDVEPGTFRKSVLLDERSEAAYLIHVDGTHVPGPMEIGSAELQAERITLLQESFQAQMGLQSFESLVRRFQLDIRELQPVKKDGDDEEDGEESADGGE
jgi:hypothetical protein